MTSVTGGQTVHRSTDPVEACCDLVVFTKQTIEIKHFLVRYRHPSLSDLDKETEQQMWYGDTGFHQMTNELLRFMMSLHSVQSLVSQQDYQPAALPTCLLTSAPALDPWSLLTPAG